MELTRLGAWLALGAMPIAAWSLAEVARAQAALVGPAWRIEEAVTLVAAGAGAALAASLTLYSLVALVAALARSSSWEPRLVPFAPPAWRRITATALGLGLSASLAAPAWSVPADDEGGTLATPVSIAWAPSEPSGLQDGPDSTDPDSTGADAVQDVSLALLPSSPLVPAVTTPSSETTASAAGWDAPVAPDTADTPAKSTYTVRRGDNLWDITRSLLGADAGNAAVAAAWPALYEANRDLVGEDPGLIHAGQVLTIPGSLA